MKLHISDRNTVYVYIYIYVYIECVCVYIIHNVHVYNIYIYTGSTVFGSSRIIQTKSFQFWIGKSPASSTSKLKIHFESPLKSPFANPWFYIYVFCVLYVNHIIYIYIYMLKAWLYIQLRWFKHLKSFYICSGHITSLAKKNPSAWKS